MKNISSMQKTIARLEDLLLPKPEPDRGPNVDYGLFTVKERAISDTIHLFHDIAVRLGHGTYNASRYHIPFEYDPNCNEEARMEAIHKATPQELERIRLEHEIALKWIRLTPLLSEEEKAAIKQYNSMANDDKFSKAPYSGSRKGPDPERFREARLLYERIMARHGAKSYEEYPMTRYVACSGIPLETLRKMDPLVAKCMGVKLA